VDPEYLVGEKGKHDGFGFALANGNSHNVWCQNEIKGVTDEMVAKQRGTKWAMSSEDGIRM
jgi:hypothetical protein